MHTYLLFERITWLMMVMMIMMQEAAEMIKLLLDHRADTTLLCNGHSPLSLAIVSGNDKVNHSCFILTFLPEKCACRKEEFVIR